MPWLVERTVLSCLVHAEERALDAPRAGAQPRGETAQDPERLEPLLDAEVRALLVPADRTDRMQNLPHANIDDSVTFGVEQRQNGRRHRQGYALESEQRIDTSRLVACRQGGTSGRPHAMVFVGPTFEKDGVRTRLIRTTNLVAQCLFGSYEMVTLPDKPNGMRSWLGNVSLSPNSQ